MSPRLFKTCSLSPTQPRELFFFLSSGILPLVHHLFDFLVSRELLVFRLTVFIMQSLLSFKGLVSGLLFAGLASAAPAEELNSRATTCNTATNRACWQNGFSVTTDYELSTPSGTLRTYEWEVTEVENWVGPDGVVKSYVQLIDGVYPGPTLFADWGDTISVTIKNSLPYNGFVDPQSKLCYA